MTETQIHNPNQQELAPDNNDASSSVSEQEFSDIELGHLLHEQLENMSPAQESFLQKMIERIESGDESATFAMDMLAERGVVELQFLQSEKFRQVERREARTDELTELPNRKSIEEWLDNIEEITDKDVWVGFIDMNLLKTINDSIGHEAGDAALKHLAHELAAKSSQLVEDNTRKIDAQPGRLGGDEFFFGVVGAPNERIKEISDSIAHGMNKLGVILEYDDQGEVSGGKLVDMTTKSDEVADAIPLKASIGFAKRQNNEPMEDVVKRADENMYQAKERSKAANAKSGDEIYIPDLSL